MPLSALNRCWVCIRNTSFSSWLTNRSNKLERLSPASLSSLVYCNTLAYFAHS
jgi:hypothetical protein